MTDRLTCPCCGNEVRLTAEPITPPEPKQQEIKLYCVKGHGGCLTKGKVYDFKPAIIMDSGYVDDNHENFADFNKVHPQFRGCLFPLVSRPAKIGEWVYVTEDYTGQHGQPNNIYKVAFDVGDNDVVFRWDGTGFVPQQNYLVLDGYSEDETPEYYSGKVVCIAKGCRLSAPVSDFTIGKVYEVRGGIITSDEGFESAPYIELDRLCGGMGWTFIPFLGESK